MKILTIFFVISFALIGCCTSYGQGDPPWGKIVPLHTNRSRVDALLGPPNVPNCERCIYANSEAKFEVIYSRRRCVGIIPGWDIGADVVLSFSIIPSKPKKIESLNLGSEKYFSYISDDLVTKYVSRETSALYIINRFGDIVSETKQPLESENAQRCKKFPPFRAVNTVYSSIETFTTTSSEEARARIINHLLAIENEGNTRKLYAIVYAGKSDSSKYLDDYLANLKRKVKKHFMGSKGPIFELIKGGRRRQFQVDLFILPMDAEPPSRNPEFRDW